MFEQEKDVEDFIITSLDSQEKSRSPPLGIEGKSDGKSESATNFVFTVSEHRLARVSVSLHLSLSVSPGFVFCYLRT